MSILLPFLYFLAPFCFIAGSAILVIAILRARKIISPNTRYVFPATPESEQEVDLPESGRYVISVVIPPLKFIVGVAHFSAKFSVKEINSAQSIEYTSFSRFNLFTVRRTDMRGNMSLPLGYFQCDRPGKYQVACTTPEKIRPEFKLEVAPYTRPIVFGALVPVIIIGSGLTLVGLIAMLAASLGRL
ncbi:hypothetical protein I2494_06990 [Budviciaceae bacterium BWR-B9]|uniref:DUF3592 domain-containing protein n=1 Tax=Limnobaculum allomyrinae TaxID=2791986 RepID=A0ABS1INY3_9GAMM|nr:MULTISPECIES: hypothetical protein [Limnobaculum]MBK5143465.1 hypothetical protein [Limnobaculum allomyrinae]MBV7691353.1 hypothetical protein [Limnobaculum sp. M2-1]